MTVSLTIFTSMFTAFDDNLTSTISTGSANIISAITPLMAACFLIYLLLITYSYWRGGGITEEPMLDFFTRMIGWVAVLTFGMNITYYTTYVVPFFNGLGDDLASALTGSTSTGSSLDTLLNAYANAIVTLVQQGMDGGIAATIAAVYYGSLMVIFAIPFIPIAAAFILLAKFSLALVLALGPLFIAAAMFPATRRFFENWIGQAVNCALLVALYAATCALQINFATSHVPTSLSIGTIIEQSVMGLAFIVISISLPNLAAALAGGVAISANAHSLRGPLGAAIKAMKGAAKPKGGSISGS